MNLRPETARKTFEAPELPWWIAKRVQREVSKISGNGPWTASHYRRAVNILFKRGVISHSVMTDWLDLIQEKQDRKPADKRGFRIW